MDGDFAGKTGRKNRERFQSTPPIWTATCDHRRADRHQKISIHAAHMDGDGRHDQPKRHLRHFNPRRPYGRRQIHQVQTEIDRLFQSTPPIWTATVPMDKLAPKLIHFNPRRPYGRRLISVCLTARLNAISIHAAHMDGDSMSDSSSLIMVTFQSTPPIWTATFTSPELSTSFMDFNPRRPYGRRHLADFFMSIFRYFNPRRPYGRRRWSWPPPPMPTHFNPRRPYGRRRQQRQKPESLLRISIHAAHMDGDPYLRQVRVRVRGNFNPRRPYGRRRDQRLLGLRAGNISIHAAHMDGDHANSLDLAWDLHFNPRRPYGRRRGREKAVKRAPKNFNPRRPYGRRRSPYNNLCGISFISIHAAHMDGDDCTQCNKHRFAAFQSTPPIWTATLSTCHAKLPQRFQSTPPIWTATIINCDDAD